MRRITAFATVSLVVALPFLAMTACKGASAVLEYDIEAEYFSEEGRLDGNMQVIVPNKTENTLEQIPFALYANAFSKDAATPPVSELYHASCYYGGESYGGMEIVGVEGGSAWSVEGEEKELLLVRLNEPLYPNDSVTLTVRYTLTLPQANHRLGIGEECVNLSYFYPQAFAQSREGFYRYVPAGYGDPFVLDSANFCVALTVPEGTKVAGGGTLGAETKDGKTVYRYCADGVREAAFVLGDFSIASEKRGETQIDYYYFQDAAPESTLAVACDAIETYSKLFGEYPYARFALAETNLFLGGMEYSGFATISSQLRKEERTAAVAHETAHQWWYALVGSDQAECAWQDEGLAEYSVALFYENNPAYGGDYRAFVSACESAYRNYFSVKSQLQDGVDTAMHRPLKDYSGDYEYRVVSYDKGVVLLDRLRGMTGDKKFFSCLKSYVKSFADKVATEYDFISCFSSQEQLISSFTEGKCVI